MQASSVGTLRRAVSEAAGLNANKHARKSDWQTDFLGAAAEMAVAKACGVFWSGDVNTFKAPDVGIVQVRSTPYENGKLIVRENDRDDETFVLVITSPPDFRIAGFQTGWYAKQYGEFRPASLAGAASWWLTQAALIPFRSAL